MTRARLGPDLLAASSRMLRLSASAEENQNMGQSMAPNDVPPSNRAHGHSSCTSATRHQTWDGSTVKTFCPLRVSVLSGGKVCGLASFSDIRFSRRSNSWKTLAPILTLKKS